MYTIKANNSDKTLIVWADTLFDLYDYNGKRIRISDEFDIKLSRLDDNRVSFNFKPNEVDNFKLYDKIIIKNNNTENLNNGIIDFSTKIGQWKMEIYTDEDELIYDDLIHFKSDFDVGVIGNENFNQI